MNFFYSNYTGKNPKKPINEYYICFKNQKKKRKINWNLIPINEWKIKFSIQWKKNKILPIKIVTMFQIMKKNKTKRTTLEAHHHHHPRRFIFSKTISIVCFCQCLYVCLTVVDVCVYYNNTIKQYIFECIE